MSGTLTTEQQAAALRIRIRTMEDAYDRLMLGGEVRVAVDPGGERVEFTARKAGDLASHIARLKFELSQLLGCTVHPQATRPMTFSY